MTIIAAAALIAVGIVVAAVAYARAAGGSARHPTGPAAAQLAGTAPATGAAASSTAKRAPQSEPAGLLAPDDGGGRATSVLASAATATAPHTANGATASPEALLHVADLTERAAALARREEAVAGREAELLRQREELAVERQGLVRELERVSGLTCARAKQLLLKEVEDQARHDVARRLRQIDEEAKREAGRRVRNILSVCMQRLAAGHAAETTVSVVQLSADDMKGRIIGREGRNIRALENLTGVDFIIDDTPGAVVLSGFDGVRREVARMTLEKLLSDGRIHPARIEETYYQAKSELEQHIVSLGEEGVFDAGVQGLNPELTKLLGRLRFRTSYGQNVLAHSIEVSRLAAMMAQELGASATTARRAALLHDIGKAVTHEIEGPHALVGGELARKYGESEAVAHAMEAHHNEVEPQTVEAVIVQAADALSGARPGARGESLEQYVKRLRDLEQIAGRHHGVDKVYAMQAGREVRIMVAPGDIDDDEATILSHNIAREIEKQLEYPGQIKVTVIRESRAVEYAR
ncbi:MAG TPA: ribonuclease Y [Solirubrobacteraceae bacterium]|nr:ribonuclease Y [Solirubrobacteraceae bacterium]